MWRPCIVADLQVSLEMMSVTIGQALDFARITDSNQLKPRRSAVNLVKLIHKCEKVMTIVGSGATPSASSRNVGACAASPLAAVSVNAEVCLPSCRAAVRHVDGVATADSPVEL